MNRSLIRIARALSTRAPVLRQPSFSAYTCWSTCTITNPLPQRLLPSSMAGYRKNSHKAKMPEELKQRIVWVDLEMTGLDIDKDQIIEMACLITDGDLNIVAEGPNIIIHQPDNVLETMNDWCIEHHGESGLTEAVKASKISLQMAEYQMLSFVRENTAAGYCPLAGNSIHVDKVYLEKHMKQFMKHLHYRIIDVSTIKELCRRWYPEDFNTVPSKKAAHRALDDIKESIKELKFYRKAIFK